MLNGFVCMNMLLLLGELREGGGNVKNNKNTVTVINHPDTQRNANLALF